MRVILRFNIKGCSVTINVSEPISFNVSNPISFQNLISRKLIEYVNQMDPLYYLYFRIRCIRLMAQALATDVRQDRVN